MGIAWFHVSDIHLFALGKESLQGYSVPFQFFIGVARVDLCRAKLVCWFYLVKDSNVRRLLLTDIQVSKS